MVVINNNTFSLIIQEKSGLERRDLLIKSIAAAMRWAANVHINGEACNDDALYQYCLAELLEELVYIEEEEEED